MPDIVETRALRNAVAAMEGWLRGHVFTLASLVQVGVVVGVFLIAFLLARPARRALERALERRSADARVRRFRGALVDLVLPLLWLLLQGFAVYMVQRADQPHEILRIAASLLTAWVVIRLASSLLADAYWARAIAVLAWTLAALNILHLLQPTIAFLDALAINFGHVRISAYLLLKGAFLATLLLWLAFALSAMFQRRIERLPHLTPSVRVLIAQTFKFTLIALAIVVAMSSVGIDLTAFALFSGAVGVGVGFGLQKVVSNLVSGIILLLDRSIKPGDVIEVAGTYGWVGSLGARYASVVTRDGTEHLIPNEDLITQRVVNWSYTDNFVRRHVAIGVSYGADIELATRLILEAAKDTERIVDHPASVCLLTGFGDSSVDLELRFWIADPQNGVSNVADQVLRRVWHKFHEHGVEIPFPQRDLHIRSPEVLRILAEAASKPTP